jgi:outer membrane receptor for monomeric catechols
VSVDGRPRGVSDEHGVVRVPLGAGRHGVSVTLLDRIPRGLRLDLAAGEQREVMVAMEPLAVGLAPITAEARSRSNDWRIQEFYRRAQNATMGRFVTRAQIEERNAIHFTDALRGLPGVELVPTEFGYLIRNPRAYTILGGNCPPRYFVDGVPHDVDGTPDTEFMLPDIEGIEVYMGNVPAQWGGSKSGCGVILIWTRTNAAPGTSASN